MAGFTCYIWWFILGILVGWLLNWLFARLFSSKRESATTINHLVGTTSPQASVLGNINTVAAAAAGIVVKGEDDLCVIEGIGPKIAEVLKSNGVRTLRELSHTQVEAIAKMLEAAGPRYKLAVPTTWPMQAELAANNRWADLKTLQDELIGGVFPTDDNAA